jgi:opacity protein-like surface antigen
VSFLLKGNFRMKKVILAIALTLSVGIASAIEVGTYAGRAAGGIGGGENLVGFSAGQKFDKIGVQATADRSTTQKVDVNRYTASVSYDVIKLGPVQTNVRAGVAYIDPQSPKTSNGGAGFAGAGVAYPVTSKINLVADYAYQKGNNITKAYNGNIVTAGVKYSF